MTSRRRRGPSGAGVLAAAFSLWVGGYALFGIADRLPDIRAPITARLGQDAR